MNYLEYLNTPQYLAAFCGVLSAILAFVESRFSKTKNSWKYYVKVAIISALNVFVVATLVKNGTLNFNKKPMSGGGEPSILNPTSLAEGGVSQNTSINPSNYDAVDISKPNF